MNINEIDEELLNLYFDWILQKTAQKLIKENEESQMNEKKKQLQKLREILKEKQTRFFSCSTYLNSLENETEKALKERSICSLDMENLESQIEKLEQEIKQEESFARLQIHRIVPYTSPLYIEISDDTGKLQLRGYLYYADMDARFQKIIPRCQFNEGFIRPDLKGISWRIPGEYPGYETIAIPELMKLMSKC